MAVTQTRKITAEDLWQLSHLGKRYELVRGELRELTPAGPEHGFVTSDIGSRIHFHVRANRLGAVFAAETGFLIRTPEGDTVRAPDVAFIARERIPSEGIPEKYWEIAPDLAVEVISPTDTYSEVMDKVNLWLEAGTRLVWVVDPKSKQIRVHRPGQPVRILQVHDTLDGEDVLLGFQCKVEEIFKLY